MNAISPTDSMAQSKFFLQLLDPATTRFCFRTFDDKKGAERTGLLSKRDGTVGQHTAQLRELNDAEAGIYVVVNEGGQTDNDITRVRAVFADIDNVDIPYEPIAEALTPHCVIESSPGKHHIYWLVHDGFPLDQFKPTQQAVAAKYGADPSVCNLSRVMRLPGFKHNKDAPHAVQFKLQNKDLPRYSISEIISGLGLSLGQHAPTTTTALTAVASPLAQALDSGGYVEPEFVDEGGRNAALVAYKGHLRGSGEYEDVDGLEERRNVMSRTYIAKLKADAEAANLRSEEAKTKPHNAGPRVLCDKPLTEQIESLMRSLPPLQRDRPWSMDELVARLQGRYSARPHPMNVGKALRHLNWVPKRDWTREGRGCRVWVRCAGSAPMRTRSASVAASPQR